MSYSFVVVTVCKVLVGLLGWEPLGMARRFGMAALRNGGPQAHIYTSALLAKIDTK